MLDTLLGRMKMQQLLFLRPVPHAFFLRPSQSGQRASEHVGLHQLLETRGQLAAAEPLYREVLEARPGAQLLSS